MARWEFSSGVDEPDPDDRLRRSDDAPDGKAWRSEQPEPGDRQQAWEESRTAIVMRALDTLREKVSPTRGDEAFLDRADEGRDRHSDREIPRLTHLWIEREGRWPAWVRDAIARRATTTDQAEASDRAPDPPGSWRGDSDRYLTPERHTEAGDTIGEIREIEPKVSADLRAVERDSTSGARLVGFEHRLKGDDRLKDKIAAQVAVRPDRTPAEITREIPDAIRYTFCVDRSNYVRGYHEIKGHLVSRGYEMYQSRNSWNDPEYKGINTRWVTPEGVRFEVQFHTVESFHAKHHITHEAYERLRDPLTCDDERAELKAFQLEVSSCIPVPDAASDISDYRKEGF